MTAALNFISRMTDELFASQMQHIAQKITERQHIFPRRGA